MKKQCHFSRTDPLIIQSLAETGRAGPYSPKLSPEAQAAQTDVLNGKLASLNEASAAHRKYVENLQEEVEVSKGAAAAAKARVEMAQTLKSKDEALARQGPDNIKQLQDSYDLHQTINPQIQALNRHAANARTDGMLDAITPRPPQRPRPPAPLANPTPQQMAWQDAHNIHLDDLGDQQSAWQAEHAQGASDRQMQDIQSRAHFIEQSITTQQGPETAGQHRVVLDILNRITEHLGHSNGRHDDSSREFEEIKNRLENLERQFANRGMTGGN